MRSDRGMTSQVFPPPSQYHMFNSPSCVGESRLSLFWMSTPMSTVSLEPSHNHSLRSTDIMIRPNGVLRSPYGEPMPRVKMCWGKKSRRPRESSSEPSPLITYPFLSLNTHRNSSCHTAAWIGSPLSGSVHSFTRSEMLAEPRPQRHSSGAPFSKPLTSAKAVNHRLDGACSSRMAMRFFQSVSTLEGCTGSLRIGAVGLVLAGWALMSVVPLLMSTVTQRRYTSDPDSSDMYTDQCVARASKAGLMTCIFCAV